MVEIAGCEVAAFRNSIEQVRKEVSCAVGVKMLNRDLSLLIRFAESWANLNEKKKH